MFIYIYVFYFLSSGLKSAFIVFLQLLNQVLNRVTAERNLFDRVVNLRLPGNSHQFPSYAKIFLNAHRIIALELHALVHT